MAVNKEIMRVVLAAKWFVLEEKGDELDIQACQKAAKALGLIQHKDDIPLLPDDWEKTASNKPAVKLQGALREMMKVESVDAFVESLLGVEPDTHDAKQCDPFSDTYQEDVEKKEQSAALSHFQKIAAIKDQLNEVVIGQEAAIEVVCDSLTRQVYRSNDNAPAGIFLFAGGSATGKTLLAHALADAMGDEWKITSVQMETMAYKNDGFHIYGLTEGYSDAKPGKITEFVRKHPKSIVVFENFDRAHSNVLSGINNVLSQGVMIDQFHDSSADSSRKAKVSFRQAIVIFTTKHSADMYDSPAFQKLVCNHPQQLESIVLNDLQQAKKKDGLAISSSFANGLASGSTALFQKLELDSLVLCAKRNIEQTIQEFQKIFSIKVECPQLDAVAQALVLSFAPEVNALSTGNDLIERLFDPLSDYFQENPDMTVKKVCIDFAKGQAVELKSLLALFEGNDVISAMFRKNQTLHIAFDLKKNKAGLQLKLGELELQRVSHAHDFRGAGAVRAEIPEVSFDNIAGHHVVKKRMLEIVKLLKKPESIEELGVDVPKGLLLWGKPGTGKTMLAKALAHEADLPFISTTGSELLDLELMKTIFKRARKYAPSILFIDEIDAIGSRGKAAGIDIIINQLLTEIDGFETSLSAPVFIVAATNLPDKIDSALLRSGRMDLKVEVPMLDREARTYFVEQYFKLPHDGSLDSDTLLNATSGMSGADLEKVQRETVLAMVSSGDSQICMTQLLEQVNIVKYGTRMTNQKLLQSLDATAYHEAGHAIVSMVLNPDVVIEQVTVMPREGALGFVSYDIESLQYRQTNKKEILDSMSVALAGRMAQTRQFPEHGHDSGASSDLQKASRLALYAITQAGLDEQIGNAVLGSKGELPVLEAGGMLFERVQAWLNEAEEQCAMVFETHWSQVDALAKKLMKEEVVTGEQLAIFLDGNYDLS